MFVKLINPVFDTLEHLALMTVNNSNYSPIDSSNLHQGDYFPAYLGNMQKVFHIFSE